MVRVVIELYKGIGKNLNGTGYTAHKPLVLRSIPPEAIKHIISAYMIILVYAFLDAFGAQLHVERDL